MKKIGAILAILLILMTALIGCRANPATKVSAPLRSYQDFMMDIHLYQAGASRFSCQKLSDDATDIGMRYVYALYADESDHEYSLSVYTNQKDEIIDLTLFADHEESSSMAQFAYLLCRSMKLPIQSEEELPAQYGLATEKTEEIRHVYDLYTVSYAATEYDATFRIQQNKAPLPWLLIVTLGSGIVLIIVLLLIREQNKTPEQKNAEQKEVLRRWTTRKAQEQASSSKGNRPHYGFLYNMISTGCLIMALFCCVVCAILILVLTN